MIYQIPANAIVYVMVRTADSEPVEPGVYCGKLLKQTAEEIVLSNAAFIGVPKITEAVEAALIASDKKDWSAFKQFALDGSIVIPISWLALDTINICFWVGSAAESKLLPK